MGSSGTVCKILDPKPQFFWWIENPPRPLKLQNTIREIMLKRSRLIDFSIEFTIVQKPTPEVAPSSTKRVGAWINLKYLCADSGM